MLFGVRILDSVSVFQGQKTVVSVSVFGQILRNTHFLSRRNLHFLFRDFVHTITEHVLKPRNSQTNIVNILPRPGYEEILGLTQMGFSRRKRSGVCPGPHSCRAPSPPLV